MNEENLSSIDVDTLISFVGIREYLVSEFLHPYIVNRGNGLRKIVLFSSTSEENEDVEIHNKSEIIIEKISSQIKELRPDVKLEIILLKNIWDIRACLEKLSNIESTIASVNITAGPSSFSVACLLWATEHGHYIEHSVESNNKFIGRIVVFRRINVLPYFKSIFLIDNVDKEIISILKRGSSTTNKIRLYLRTSKHIELTLRTVQNRVSRMNEIGIISVSKGRNNIIELSDDYKKLS
ncbi:MAG: hypothetical protein B2I18_01845 [Cuniculiplasma sp. C_DKE]|jgi:hypothetical protein|nr:MAG: hypothetical protein B2I18_01845 [Cuniculiplasma sp. C_DKE]